jgi:hypothetical protein
VRLCREWPLKTSLGSNARRRGWQNAVLLIDVQDPAAENSIMLMDLGKKNYAMHLSAGPAEGFCSLYDPTNALPNQIWRLPFDGSAPEKLHEWRAPYMVDYEPRATCSGNLILYNVPDGSGHCRVQGLYLSPPQDEGTPVEPPPEVGDRYALIDYTPFEGRNSGSSRTWSPAAACSSQLQQGCMSAYE